ncbi:hypothetical protein B0T16DRAFT_134252 [Cercophora newfieldiana]|uniref:Uncharacterized protein n=1 Tax=Cercophora newfieldiana TaxID=92897 RepID=A0AA39YDN3_9PEZI|nr:hypothetical protein B0T16DRAFT_134252 [Cercophora newfieldiana]
MSQGPGAKQIETDEGILALIVTAPQRTPQRVSPARTETPATRRQTPRQDRHQRPPVLLIIHPQQGPRPAPHPRPENRGATAGARPAVIKEQTANSSLS